MHFLLPTAPGGLSLLKDLIIHGAPPRQVLFLCARLAGSQFMCVEARSQHWVLPQILPVFVVFIQGLSLSLEFTTESDWLASELQGSDRFCPEHSHRQTLQDLGLYTGTEN